MLDTFSLTASEVEAAAIAELKTWLLEHIDMPTELQFEALIANTSLLAKISRYLSRDDNALIVDIVAEMSATSGLRNGHLMGSSIILADNLFLEPMFNRIGLATYPVNFAQTVLDHDEKGNRVTGSGLIRAIGSPAHTLMVLVRGTQTGRMGVAALRVTDLEVETARSDMALCTFTVNARPSCARMLNERGVDKAVKEVCVCNIALALGVLRSARTTTEVHAKKHILFGRPLLQHQATQIRLSQSVVNEELLRVIAIRQYSEYGALCDRQSVTIRKIRDLIQQTLTDLAHLHGAESVLGRTQQPFLDLRLTLVGMIDDLVA